MWNCAQLNWYSSCPWFVYSALVSVLGSLTQCGEWKQHELWNCTHLNLNPGPALKSCVFSFIWSTFIYKRQNYCIIYNKYTPHNSCEREEIKDTDIYHHQKHSGGFSFESKYFLFTKGTYKTWWYIAFWSSVWD